MGPQIKAIVNDIRQNYDVMFVIGIGGSYAGSKAAIDFLKTDFPVEFIGHGYETENIENLWQKYAAQRIKLCIISKSGKTFEITAALEYMVAKLQQKYGDQCYQHMLAITSDTGKLHDYATAHQMQTILHPEEGGRYSVLTVVGLFPMAVAGIDTDAMLAGAKHLTENEQDLIYAYAKNRLQQYQDGKMVEVFAVSTENAAQIGNWYQQLFGESEGKEHQGMWTSVLVYSRDLHSMGQFIQQGSPILCETIINIQDPNNQMSEMNQICITAVTKAHEQAGIKVFNLDLPRTAYDLGRLFCLFMKACVIYCQDLGVNPFDQPGVENYKSEMRRLLNK